MNNKRNINDKGFTMVELIVVVAIIAVLAVVLAPQYIKYVEKSRIAADVTTLTNIEKAINMLVADEELTAKNTIIWNTDGKLEVKDKDGGDKDVATNKLYKNFGIDSTSTALKAKSKKATQVIWELKFTDKIPQITVTTPATGYRVWAE